ncbi:glycoside hydrolase family 16 protein [Muriicola sp. Z0-33]|nr:glycoside hydrolase family 16 protein [Muriicola sp. Z0-33]
MGTLLFFTFPIFDSNKTVNSSSENKRKKSNQTTFDTLVWSDEFEGKGAINSEKWFHQTKLPPGGSWWGGLIQHYTNREDNTFLKDGHLYLVAKKEKLSDQGEVKEYTSARLNSKFTFTYGRVEIRAKLPKGKGTWPAIWMLNKNINEDGAYWENKGFGTTVWPYCGEIDILEHWGKNQNFIQSGLHNASSYGDKVINIGGHYVENVSDQFHIYSLEWSKEKIVFSVDGIEHYTYKPYKKDTDTWPYDTPYYLILNVAIEADIDPQFVESAMEVDYIRVFQ